MNTGFREQGGGGVLEKEEREEGEQRKERGQPGPPTNSLPRATRCSPLDVAEQGSLLHSNCLGLLVGAGTNKDVCAVEGAAWTEDAASHPISLGQAPAGEMSHFGIKN